MVVQRADRQQPMSVVEKEFCARVAAERHGSLTADQVAVCVERFRDKAVKAGKDLKDEVFVNSASHMITKEAVE